jgi:hypothetical protein
MNIDTWAVVLATIIGPLAAVFITRWNDQRREARNRLLPFLLVDVHSMIVNVLKAGLTVA